MWLLEWDVTQIARSLSALFETNHAVSLVGSIIDDKRHRMDMCMGVLSKSLYVAGPRRQSPSTCSLIFIPQEETHG